MPVVDIYVGEGEARRRRRRRKWIVPLIVGVGAAFALGREKTVVPVPPPQPVVVGPLKSRPIVFEPSVERSIAAVPVTAPATPLPLPGRLAVEPVRLDFGDGPLARGVAAQLSTIRNDGEQPLVHVSAVVDGPFIATSGCPGALAPRERCSIAVVFAPKEPGAFNGALKIVAGQQSGVVRLRGSVPQPPAPAPVAEKPPARTLCFEPAIVRFTTVGRQTITVTNPEPTPLRVVAVLPTGREGQTLSGYEVDSGKCLRVLNPREQCRFAISASARALQSRETMQLTIYYDDPVGGGLRPARFSAACGGR